MMTTTDCGHEATPRGCASGTAVTPEGQTICLACAEQREINAWAERPDRYTVYYRFPHEGSASPRQYRPSFDPLLTGATVTTWTGVTLGTIVDARVSPHNFGGRVVAIRVSGTNGANYYGRASWDNGNVITLRRAK